MEDERESESAAVVTEVIIAHIQVQWGQAEKAEPITYWAGKKNDKKELLDLHFVVGSNKYRCRFRI
jgi:hypothetical protein